MAATVVCAAVVRHGRVLAARRTRPVDLAGRWELPGGKVEPGESEPAALLRELQEELRLNVEVGVLLGRTCLGAGRDLVVYRCTAKGAPRTGEDHDEVRWLSKRELGSVDWLEADRELLPAITAELT